LLAAIWYSSNSHVAESRCYIFLCNLHRDRRSGGSYVHSGFIFTSIEDKCYEWVYHSCYIVFTFWTCPNYSVYSLARDSSFLLVSSAPRTKWLESLFGFDRVAILKGLLVEMLFASHTFGYWVINLPKHEIWARICSTFGMDTACIDPSHLSFPIWGCISLAVLPLLLSDLFSHFLILGYKR